MPMKSQIRILGFLAINGPTNKYQIEKGTDLNHATVHKNVRILKARRYIEDVEREKARTGLPKITWDLTPRGFIHAILDEKAYNAMDVVAKRAAERGILKLVFGKWDHFIKMKVKEIAKRRLYTAFLTTYLREITADYIVSQAKALGRQVSTWRPFITVYIGKSFWGPPLPAPSEYLFFDNPELIFTNDFLFLTPLFPIMKYEKESRLWRNAILNDSELKAFTIAMLHHWETSYGALGLRFHKAKVRWAMFGKKKRQPETLNKYIKDCVEWWIKETQEWQSRELRQLTEKNPEALIKGVEWYPEKG